jgi:hypothetical protein
VKYVLILLLLFGFQTDKWTTDGVVLIYKTVADLTELEKNKNLFEKKLRSQTKYVNLPFVLVYFGNVFTLNIPKNLNLHRPTEVRLSATGILQACLKGTELSQEWKCAFRIVLPNRQHDKIKRNFEQLFYLIINDINIEPLRRMKRRKQTTQSTMQDIVTPSLSKISTNNTNTTEVSSTESSRNRSHNIDLTEPPDKTHSPLKNITNDGTILSLSSHVKHHFFV